MLFRSPVSISKPDEVAQSPDRSAIWDTVVGDGGAYLQQDVPALTQLVFWMDVARHIRQQLSPDGEEMLLVLEDDMGHMRDNPLVRQLDKATSNVMRLSDQLGCTPLSRARIGITETATQSMQVDIAKKIRAIAAGDET